MKNNRIILTTLAPKTHRTSEENLGLGYLKACLVKKGYEVIIIDGWLSNYSVNEVFEKIISYDAALVGISSYMSNTIQSFELIKKIKKHNKDLKIVCGGFGPTFYPKEYLEAGSDYIIRGEGEKAICDLADSLQYEKEQTYIGNLGFFKDNILTLNKMENLIEDLDSIPFPIRDTIDIVKSQKSSINMITSRGCSGNCDFCSVISFFRLSNGKLWRTRSIKNIVDEIELLTNNGVKLIKMVDDSFVDGNRDEKWCKLFADEIEKRNIKVKLRGQIRADKVTDSVLYHLKRAGFFSFACGIENGSPSSLSRMGKKATLKDNERALELFEKYGYLVQMGYILFDKGTTLQELVDNYYFLLKYDFAITKGIFSEMFSAEGTKLNSRLRKENQLIEDDNTLNNKYIIDDLQANKVYNALKKWHKSHCEIYDMTIDPLIAPKEISDNAIQDFYKYTMLLKRFDLLFFKNILMEIKNKNININDYINNYILNTKDDYDMIRLRVKELYKNNNISYKADVNPFI